MADLTGTGAADIIIGGIDGDLIRGKGGADQLFGNEGDDRIKGGGGNDEMTDGAGQDRMWGGNGDDIFRLSVDGEKDRILDWEPNDLIDLSDWGVSSLQDITFQELSNGQIRLTVGNEELQIKGKGGVTLTTADFDASKFVFAPTPPQTVDFESLQVAGPGYGAPIEVIDAGHEGFAWSEGFYFLEESDVAAATGNPGGVANRSSSGNVVALNGFGSDVDFSRADNFDFEEATFGAVWNDGLSLRIIAMDDGMYVGEQLVTLSTTGSTLVALDDQTFDSVDQVVFQSFGGTKIATSPVPTGFDSTHFYMDDMVIA